MNRGDIWEADLGGKAGKRPVVILTRSGVIPHLSKIVIVEVTTQAKNYTSQVAIGQAGNLRKASFVSAENLYTVPKERLLRFIGELPDELLEQVSRAVVFALDLGSVVV